MRRASGAAASLALLAAGCAAPVEGLWPPRDGEPRVPIRVLSNGWHSLLFVPDLVDPERGWREWSFGEWEWYRADEATIGMVFPAMLWPTRATVHVVEIESLEFVESAPPDVFTIWRFDVTRAGHERLLAWLRASRLADLPAAGTARSAWFDTDRSYHLFGHCNHWTAEALREAGLPIWSAYALCHTGLAWQLDRVENWDGG
ncbi:MAG: DUF2459 domain-containing protein [Planctomycetota bacterium JB042]